MQRSRIAKSETSSFALTNDSHFVVHSFAAKRLAYNDLPTICQRFAELCTIRFTNAFHITLRTQRFISVLPNYSPMGSPKCFDDVSSF